MITVLFFFTAWEGSMDIQFIGEHTSFLTRRITKYVKKAGKSELADSILNSINSENRSLASYFWMEYCLTNDRGCGALEASDASLGVPLYGTDRDTTAKRLDVNQTRYRKLKNQKEILIVNLLIYFDESNNR